MLAAAAAPSAAQPLRYTIAPQRVGEGVWIIRGADEPIAPGNGGAIANIVIIATDAGAVLVDAGPSLRFGSQLKGIAAQLVGKPVARIYLTHLHPDHDYGATAFDPAIVAAAPGYHAVPLAEHRGFSDGMYRLLGDWMRGTEYALPGRTIAGESEVIGGRRLRLMPLAGHSGSDLAVLDERSGILIAGDLVFHDRAPSTPHADIARWKQSLAMLRTVPHKALVPGHGPFDRGSPAAIDQTEAWLDWLTASLRSAVENGLDMVEAGNLPIPARFAGLKAARYELQRSVAHLYPGLEAALLPRIDKR